MPEQRALLLIADISGYTRFMKFYRVSLTHAQEAVRQLLEAIIDAAEPAFTVAKLEGDAVFFYALLPGASSEVTGEMTQRARLMRRAFKARQNRSVVDRICNCDACVQVGDLKLKFVAHLGEIAFQKVKHFSELAGVDVIVLHRLLKNSVPVKEYILMTEPVAQHLSEEHKGLAQGHQEDLEGIGPTQLSYLDLEAMGQIEVPEEKRSTRRAWSGLLNLVIRGAPYLLHLRTPAVDLRNLAP